MKPKRFKKRERKVMTHQTDQVIIGKQPVPVFHVRLGAQDLFIDLGELAVTGKPVLKVVRV